MAAVSGFVEKIKYRNEDNGYSVLDVSAGGEDYVLVGTFPYIGEGEMIEARGTMTEHPVYGEQLQVETYTIKTPEDSQAMERYLGSGAIKGVKAALAARIVRRFKADTFRIIEEEPERLAEIKGVSEKMAMSIASQMEAKKGMRHAMMFLQQYGVSMNLSAKIYKEYGDRMYGIIKENPYRLADDIAGVGFKMADEIARRAGIVADSDYRIKAGILYTLYQAAAQGHTYLPRKELFSQASELLKVEAGQMEKYLMDMQMEKRLVIKRPSRGQPDLDKEEAMDSDEEDKLNVYASTYYYMELNVARMLHDLNIKGHEPEENIQERLSLIQKEEKMELDLLQIPAWQQFRQVRRTL